MPELIGKLGYDGSGWSAGMNQAVGEAKQAASKAGGYFSQAFGSGGLGGGLAAGGAAALGLGKVFETLTGLADKVGESFKSIKMGMAQMAGVSLDTYQRLANVTEKTGTGPETFTTFVDHLAISLEKIRNGEEGFEKLIAAAREFGISIDDIKKKGALEIGLKIFGSLAGSGPPSDAIRAAMHELGGRSAGSLIPAAQLGLGSPTAVGGKLTEGEFAKFQEKEEVDRYIDARMKESDKLTGLGWHNVLSNIRQTYFNVIARLTGKVTTGEAAEDRAAGMAEQMANAKEDLVTDKLEADAQAAKFIEEQRQKRQRQADLETAAARNKETSRLSGANNKEEESARLAAMSPSERRGHFQELHDLAGKAEADYKRQADEAKFEGDREKDEANFRSLQEQNRAVRLNAQRELMHGELRQGFGQNIDSLARIGGFTQRDGANQDIQTRMLTAAERTAQATTQIANEQ